MKKKNGLISSTSIEDLKLAENPLVFYLFIFSLSYVMLLVCRMIETFNILYLANDGC